MRRQSLPPEVYYSYVLPDLLSEHLHQYLVHSECPEWNPFYVLPLVSKSFRASCRTLCVNIFGLEQDEGGSVIRDIIDKTKYLWDQANLPPKKALPMRTQCTFQHLMSSNSLIQIYLCTALAKCFINVDVLYTIQMQKEWVAGNYWDVDEDEFPPSYPHHPNSAGLVPRRFRLRDDLMHRPYLPLTCALKLCDRVRPDRIAHIIAEYLADWVPLCVTAPLMLKYTQDLETYINREHGDVLIQPQTWFHWTFQTLGLIGDLESVLQKMHRSGKLVKSFNPGSTVPMEVICDTDIINVLEAVANVDWGPHTEEIHHLSLDTKDNLLQAHISDEE